MLKDLKNDYKVSGVMMRGRGPYLSRGDKDYRTPENCSHSQQNSKSQYDIVLEPSFLFFFFGHLSVIDRIFLAMIDFFFGHNEQKKFAIILV